MSVRATPETQIPYDRYAADRSDAHDDDRGHGWVAFAGTLRLMPGTRDLIEGIAAIGNSHFFVKDTHTSSATSTPGAEWSYASGWLSG
jgi:hypothetical protein